MSTLLCVYEAQDPYHHVSDLPFVVNSVIKLDTREGSLTEKALARVNLTILYPAGNTDSERPRVAKSFESLLRFG